MSRPDASKRRRTRFEGVPGRLARRGRATAPPVIAGILSRMRTPGFKSYLGKLLVELCRIQYHAPSRRGENVAGRGLLLRNRGAGIAWIELRRNAVRKTGLTLPSSPTLITPRFTSPRLPAAGGVVAGRSLHSTLQSGLVVPGAAAPGDGQSAALNAHLDVVAPFFSPRVRRGVVHGRGACDDKGPVVSIVAALKVLSDVMPAAGLRWNRNLVAMFVVEEETGGNGSLSLAIRPGLEMLYDSVLVSECTGLRVHPANRGAVWYRAELRPPPEIPAIEMSAFVIEEMEKEGAAIRAESRHALFPQRPVQTCHGIIGAFGEHPSRICGRVSFHIRFNAAPTTRRRICCAIVSIRGWRDTLGSMETRPR